MRAKATTSAQAQILKRLQDGKKVSQLSVLREFGCMRLAAVIYRLRKLGYSIETETRHQRGKQYAVYRLVK